MNPAQQAKLIKKKRRKVITTLVILIIFLTFIIGKKVIEYLTVDYKPVVKESFDKFYISGNTSDLSDVLDLLNKYEKQEKTVEKIQAYAFEVVGQWYTYLDDKYLCNMVNVMACKSQLEEFKILNDKLERLYNYRSGNLFLILPSAYTNLKNEGEKKIKNLNEIVTSDKAKSPLNSEVIYTSKCAIAVDCVNCKEGVCSCTFNNTEKKTQVPITCYRPETIQQ